MDRLNPSKLRWHCRRGVKELDVVLVKWFEKHFESADLETQYAFADLLDIEDPELFGMVTGATINEYPAQQRVLEQIVNLSTPSVG